jgi:hypothetical protein
VSKIKGSTQDEELFDPVDEMERTMQATGEAPDEPDPAPASQDAINERLTKALEILAENSAGGPIKQIPIGRAKVSTPWNPTGERLRPRLKRVTRMNGFKLQEFTLNNRTIRMFNLLKAGKYNGGKWVVIDQDDREGSSINLYVPNKSVADRLETKAKAKDIEALLEIILTEQGEQVEQIPA